MSKLGYSQRIKQRILDLENTVASAQAELDELRIAERVLNRLGTVTEEKGPDDGQSRTSTTSGGTVADRAIEVLINNGPMDTTAILMRLQVTWRSDLKQTTLASTLSRVKAEGRIEAVNGQWHVVRKEKESPDGDSQSIGGDVEASDTDDDATDLLV
jgi:hypothetical protein